LIKSPYSSPAAVFLIYNDQTSRGKPLAQMVLNASKCFSSYKKPFLFLLKCSTYTHTQKKCNTRQSFSPSSYVGYPYWPHHRKPYASTPNSVGKHGGHTCIDPADHRLTSPRSIVHVGTIWDPLLGAHSRSSIHRWEAISSLVQTAVVQYSGCLWTALRGSSWRIHFSAVLVLRWSSTVFLCFSRGNCTSIGMKFCLQIDSFSFLFRVLWLQGCGAEKWGVCHCITQYLEEV